MRQMHTFVLVPGLGSDTTVWERTIHELHGKVHCLIGDTLSDDTLVGMAQRILDQSPERFALAGVSMGGIVAMQMVQMAPERIVCLALVDTIARPDSFYTKTFRRLSNILVSILDFQRLARFSVRSMVHRGAPDDVRTALVDMSLRVGVETYRRQNRAVLARIDYRTSLANIVVPTTVVVCNEDRMTPESLSRDIQQLIPGSTFQLINQSGHLPPIEKPKVMAAILAELLAKVAPASH